MNLGICMAGLEPHFERALRTRFKPGQPFHYVEIGVAYCQTLRTVVDILSDIGEGWTATGIDPWDAAKEHFLKQDLQARWPWVQFSNMTRDAAFQGWHAPIHFCFIDGCHSKACVMGDFQAVEPHVVPGGLVVFHDIEPERVGSDIQPHCGVKQDVRGALGELGLLEGVRPGWVRLPDWQGDRAQGGADCGVFERTQV